MDTRTLRDEVQGADVVYHVIGDGPRLVVISHGSGGSPHGYRGLADHLATQGFTCALVEHPGNKRGDDALANAAENLVNRPRHLRLVIDALAPSSPVAVIGHSMGGYTALALAGGNPLALPDQTPDATARPLVVEHDARVGAVVLLGPAIPWLMAPGALANVRVPVLALLGENDPMVPPYFVKPILAPLANLDVRVVPNAGHFAWFWPVPPPLVKAGLPPALDPPGFDRAAYQAQFHADVTRFLRSV